MKFRLTVLFPVLFSSICSFSQQELISSAMQLKEFESTTILPVVDKKDNIHLFSISKSILDESIINEIVYNPTTNTLLRKKHSKPDAISLKDISGLEITDNNLIGIYFHSKGKGIFNRITIGSEKGSIHQTFELKLKKEKVIQYISHKGKFTMLTVQRNGSTINCYSFDGVSYDKKSFDFNGERFYDKENKLTNLDQILNKNFMSTITTKTYNEPMRYSRYTKVFPDDNGFTITLNHRKNGTRTLYLDLKNNLRTADYYNIPTAGFSSGDRLKANSFLHQDILYSMITSKSEMVITLNKWNTKEKLKEFRFNSDDEQAFTLTEILDGEDKSSQMVNADRQQAESSRSKKEMSMKKFLKLLINTPFSGLSASSEADAILLAVGGFMPPQQSSAPMMMHGAPSIINTPAGMISIQNFTPPIAINGFKFGAFSYERKLLLSKNNLELSPKKPTISAQDKISYYLGNLKRVGLETSFQYHDDFMLGYYDKKEKTYHLVQFTD